MATQVVRPYDVLEGPIPRRKSPRRPAPAPGKQRERLAKPSKAADFGKGATLRPAPVAKAAAGLGDVYAGSGFANSPAPSALPLPRFSLKKDGPAVGEFLATAALRRMLRLE